MNAIKRLLLLLALLPLTASADEVPADRARSVAENFLQQGKSTRAGAPQLTLRWTGEQLATRSEGEPAFYVFENRGGGYVIVSGETSVEPILAYSAERSFDPEHLPANVRAWLRSLQRFILRVRAEQRPATARVAALWKNNGLAKSSETYTPLLHETAQWNQGRPYNTFCPVVDGQQSVTGCVATAAAIVMRWHQWPEAGSGSLPGYSYYSDAGTTVDIAGHDLGHKYDWSNMPLNDGAAGGWSRAQQEAVAQLMYDCGVMAKMNYNAEGSGAYSPDELEGLYTYMHYDKTASYLVKCVYPAETWKQMLRNNLANYGPTIYDGFSKEGDGHNFVLDGYDENGLFHINFGWGGYYNDYYAFPEFDDYVLDHKAMFGLKKDEGGEETPYLTLEPGGDFNGLELSEGSFDSEFLLKAGYFVCYKGTFSGQIGFAHTDKNGRFKEVLESLDIGEIWEEGLPSGYVFGYEYFGVLKGAYIYGFTLEEPIERGDKLIAVSRNTPSDTWTAVPYDVESPDFVGEIDLTPYVETIDTRSSFAYDRQTRVITITTLAGATVSLLSGTTEAVSGIAETGTFTIETGSLAAGAYTLRIEKAGDSKTMTIKIGNKQ